MRFRASWAVILAAALLVGLLAYGVASKRADRSIDAQAKTFVRAAERSEKRRKRACAWVVSRPARTYGSRSRIE